MLLTELILSKRGPLAKVWLSAHHERKLSKQQTLGVDVEESVDAILTQDEGPTTLRLSGQLMLGVTRIYSRKVQYLLDDCKETKDRISLAFRPGVVDLPEDQIKASKNAITFSDARNDFDFFDWSWNAPAGGAEFQTSKFTASQAKILKPTTKEFGAYNFGQPAPPSLYGGSSSRHGSHDGETSSHLDSQDFSGIDLDLNLDDFAPGRPADDAFSVEMGRRESASRQGSVMSEMIIARGRDSSVGMGNFDAGGFDAGFDGGFDGGAEFEQVDLHLDLDAFGADEPLPELRKEGRAESIISSTLSTPPPASPQETVDADITPRTAVRIAKAPERLSEKRVKKPRMIRADQELELDDSYFAAPKGDSAILRQDDFVAFDAASAGLLGNDSTDPADIFLPTVKVGNESMIYAGPAGLAEELREFFMFPTTVLRRGRAASGVDDGEERQAKRPRLEAPEADEQEPEAEAPLAHEDEEVEIGRRQSTLPPDFDFDPLAGRMGPDDTFDFQPDNMMDDQPMFDLGDNMTPRKETPAPDNQAMRQPSLAPSLAPSRAESLARQVQYGETGDEYALAMFDARTGVSESQSQSQAMSQSQVTPTKSVASEAMTKGGYSKNTGMAMGLLRRELEVIEGEAAKKVEFDQIAQKASKRAAATFFFELLVLGTRDCVKLEQKKPFEGIEVRGKEKLWEEIAA
ncbi:Rec8 like protein-domain-containing protein [Dioszegia hungarica]|uniref:Rec8 like protein-domain-containing protein n=1 Tax=Dioszegia hungarica TaxID=4972 RepID=A0AA38H9M5_9TREE|nr:Rec8 like protein-domain-containing protein [Dioszegia hungarica]KAI9635449.1 Rec8 like protein-domain-containing protein [Dioszegia hungarica]